MATPSRQEQFEQLFRTMYPKVKNFAAKLLCSEDDAEDIAQDIFVKLWDNPLLLEEMEMQSSYIFTMTRNRVLDFIRRKAVRKEYSSKTPEWHNIDTDTGNAIHNSIYAKEIKILALMAVENMPEQRQKVFRMSRIDNMSNADIAEKLGLSVRTVERHIYLAIKDIRDILMFFTILLLQ